MIEKLYKYIPKFIYVYENIYRKMYIKNICEILTVDQGCDCACIDVLNNKLTETFQFLHLSEKTHIIN